MTPQVLLITNHPTEGGCPGQIDGLRLLVDTGEIAGLEVISGGHQPGAGPAQTSARVVAALRTSKADIVLVLSPKDRIPDVESVASALAGRPLLYWEGDSFGRAKPIPPAMAGWLQCSDVVFSVAGSPQPELLERAGARKVVQTVHTYDHVLFADAEAEPQWREPARRVVALGNNLMRLPLLGGLPGTYGRRRAMGELRRALGPRFQLAGRGWPRRWGIGEVPYADQIAFIQSGRVLANWDHFPDTVAYTSDRMAITMIAARPQVTTRHPGMPWLPGMQDGLFQVDSPRELVDVVTRVCELPSGELRELGARGHAWVRHRLSHREAMRHMLSRFVDGVAPPQGQPWESL